MTKQSGNGVVVKTTKKDSKPNKKASGNAKKQPKGNAMIASWDELRKMTIGEFEQSIDRLDLDKLVDYKADTYYVKADKRKEHPKEALFIPLNEPVGDKTHKFIGQTDAIAIGDFATANPMVAVLTEIAYRRGNPYI